jgi:hypothetical protein
MQRGAMKAHLPALMIVALAIIGLAADGHAQSPEATGFEFAIREAEGGEPNQIADPRIFLTIETYDTLSCWSIPVQVEVTADAVRLDVSDPIPPPAGTGCIAVPIPATADMPLDLALGDYHLAFNWRGMTDTYDLVVTDNYTELTAKSATFTSPHFNQMFGPHSLNASYDVPGHSRWYRFSRDSFILTCGSVTGDEQFCDAFTERIQSLDVSPIELASDGVWPFPTQPNGHYYDAPTRLYKYKTEAVWNAAKAEVADYIEGIFSTCGRSVAVENWRNDFADSWLIRDTGCDYPYSGTPSLPTTGGARTMTSSSSATSSSALPDTDPSDNGDDPIVWVLVGIAAAAVVIVVTLAYARRHHTDQSRE